MSELRTLRFNVVAQAAPSWTSLAAAVGQWVQISSNTMASVRPGQKAGDSFSSAEISGLGDFGPTTYSGGVLATGYGQNGGLIVWGGGHNDYHGNEVYAFDLHTGAWDRISDPFVGYVSTLANGNVPTRTGWQSSSGTANPMLVTRNLAYSHEPGMYPAQAAKSSSNVMQSNGSPGVPHTYDSLWYVAATNSMYCSHAQVNYEGPNKTFPLVRFDLGARQWSPVLPHDDTYAAAFGSAGNAAYNAGSDSALVYGPEDYKLYSRKVIEFTSMSGVPVRATYTRPASLLPHGMAYSPTHGMVTFSANSNVSVALHKLYKSSTTAFDKILLTPTGAPVSANTFARSGWEWSPNLGAFVLCPDAGDTLFAAYVAGNAVTWSQISTSNSSGAGASAVGLHGRFQVVTYGSIDYAVVVREKDQPVYAARLN